mmetsp:Transcript_76553/g.199504  ORF Transcript_76553/g.199504 Transcript_76553/m.199504 type:complete len:205 (-) Transcript_76553:1465-2079(-)
MLVRVARPRPPDAHDHVPDVIEMARDAPRAPAQQVAPLLRTNVVHSAAVHARPHRNGHVDDRDLDGLRPDLVLSVEELVDLGVRVPPLAGLCVPFVSPVCDKGSEIVLLDIGIPEEAHADNVQNDPDNRVHVVVGYEPVVAREVRAERWPDRRAIDLDVVGLSTQEPQKREGVVPAEEPKHAVREHEAEEIVADVRRGEVGRLH